MSNVDVVVFEQLTRPFAVTNISPPKPQPAATAAPGSGTVTASFGANGSGKTFNGSSNYNRSEYQDKKPRELFGHGQEVSFQFPPITFP